MKQWFARKRTLFYGFQLRHAVALLVCLAIILILAGYFSVSAGQKAALEAVVGQGRALTETLLASAEMVIESDKAITSVAIDRLIQNIDALNIKAGLKEPSLSDQWRDRLDADKVAIVTGRRIDLSSTARDFPFTNNEIQNWLDSLRVDPDAEIIYEFRTSGADRYFWGYFPSDDSIGLYVAINWRYGQYGNEKLSLYYLLNQVGQESGVEYIMLQNAGGIVFASKKVASMPRLTDDPFLVETLQTDTTRSRIITFQDREVLESARNFRSRDFEGVFRVGLSLYGYRQISAGIKRQVWLVVAALIVLGMLAVGIIVGFQNFDVLRAGLDKASLISQSLLDSIPGPVVAIDSDFKITDINSVARETFGIPANAGISSDYRSYFPDDPFRFSQVLAGMRSASFERTLTPGNRQFLFSTTPMIAASGAPLGAIAIAQDITDIRKFEGMAESRRRLSELGALAASMAHEIRNPLNAIGITIQRMKNEIVPASGEDEFKKFLDGLRGEIKRLNDIIDKFLSVARAVRPEISEIDVRKFIGEAVGIFENQAQAQHTALIWNAPDVLSISGDRAALTQALINIIKNSLEALGHNGSINIEAAQQGEKVVISVQDNGPGMADTSQALKPFYTTKKDGTGLGLATASKILADHGGELVIESSPGKGFRVDLILVKEGRGR